MYKSRRVRALRLDRSLNLTVMVMFSAMMVLATGTPQKLRLDQHPRLHVFVARPRGPTGSGAAPHGRAHNRFAQKFPSCLIDRACLVRREARRTAPPSTRRQPPHPSVRTSHPTVVPACPVPSVGVDSARVRHNRHHLNGENDSIALASVLN